MADLYYEIETRPYLLYLNQINIPALSLGISNPDTEKIAEGLAKWKVNFTLPIVCLTDEEDQYQLLTGLSIYKAAEVAEVQKIWVFLIAAKQPEAEEAIEQVLLQSRHNQRVGENEVGEIVAEFQAEEKVTEPQGGETIVETQVEVKLEKPQDVKDFLAFINDTDSNLNSISGIGKTYTQKISDQRPYTSLEDMRNKLGAKAPMKKWLQAYQQMKSQGNGGGQDAHSTR
jgi:DNA uptake protein ComE-like DNA-binding protein